MLEGSPETGRELHSFRAYLTFLFFFIFIFCIVLSGSLTMRSNKGKKTGLQDFESAVFYAW